jgi:hypothetical protein
VTLLFTTPRRFGPRPRALASPSTCRFTSAHGESTPMRRVRRGRSSGRTNRHFEVFLKWDEQTHIIYSPHTLAFANR